MSQAAASGLLRLLNCQSIIDAMFAVAPQPVSRAELASITGLSKPTVSALMRTLETDGLVRLADTQTGSGGVGRPAAFYSVVPEASCVIAADIGATKVAVGIADLLGTIVIDRELPTGPDAVQAVDTVCDAAARMLSDRGNTAGYACIGVPGVYRPEIDRVEQSVNLPGFDELGLKATLEQRLGVSVHVDNDVNLAALGEANARGDDEATDFAVISVGTGIGMGLVLNGDVYRGGSGAAGEIGSISIAPRHGETGRATLEDLASAPAIRKHLVAAIEAGHPSRLGGSADVPEILEATHRGDLAASFALNYAAEAMASAISHLCFIADPQHVVLGGGVGANPLFAHAVERCLHAQTEHRIEVSASTLQRRATFLGAASYALKCLRESLITSRLG